MGGRLGVLKGVLWVCFCQRCVAPYCDGIILGQ